MKEEWNDLKRICLEETSRDPIVVLEKLMAQPFCRMHGPEHHVIVGSALLTAYRNAGGQIDLPEALRELNARGSDVPGAVCGLWGACGACISTGQFLSVVTGSGPLEKEQWGLCMQMTAASLNAVAEVGGPRCCKRDSYLSVLTAADFVRRKLGVTMETTKPVCNRSHVNAQCVGSRCPFFGGDR